MSGRGAEAEEVDRSFEAVDENGYHIFRKCRPLDLFIIIIISVHVSLCLSASLPQERGKEQEEETENKAKAEEKINLPKEIVLDILSRLPLKSLVRSICVSKQWCSLLKDFGKSIRQPKLFAKTNWNDELFSLQSIDQQGYVKSIHIPLPLPWKKSLSRDHMIHFIEIFGSCNGLLLIRINNDLFLWNLLTRCSKKVLGHKHMQ
ncbi:putative F-box protein [Camellia lanceoleosa]|uniref:F-box protein n=1 Tax=Camellia lanceoleosa TaxID=1840588 RepID=A0ACC0FFX7_9ERIC|nr:putative F-box protein [Camellia lanceoleosa]